MKLKINKACDLSSISVLPPHGRFDMLTDRSVLKCNDFPPKFSVAFSPEEETRAYGLILLYSKSIINNGVCYRRPSATAAGVQASQIHSQQQSQQSFSQGISAQHGIFSQISQNSSDDFPSNEQRYSSQEPENSLKKISTLVNYTQEDIRMPLSRNSSNFPRKWNSTPITDSRYHISEELEHRIGLMETSLSRFGMILDSVQGDVMQVSKGTKEISLGMESIQQKLISHNSLLQQMKKEQEDVKASLDAKFALISDQLSKGANENKFFDIYPRLLTIPGQVEAALTKLQDQLSYKFTREMQAFTSILKLTSQKPDSRALVPSKVLGRLSSIHSSTGPISSSSPHLIPKVEMGGWKSVKQEKRNNLVGLSRKDHMRKEIYSFEKVPMPNLSTKEAPPLMNIRRRQKGSSGKQGRGKESTPAL
ncbi:hypothetical protein SAY87_030855 [Trapa incisa]|uniref:Uncharacterized protein n=2 Tax=Trapa incisa TaxID=236973 RepID=A0AAN7KJL5_9MYRT|nr:hypothetical protein SAY87_030855 [Trapa incisa]